MNSTLLLHPNINVEYTESNILNTLPTIAVQNIVAFNSNNVAQNLNLGGTSNINMQALKDINIEHGDTSKLVVSTADSTGASNSYLSVEFTDRVVLSDVTQSGVTLTSTDTIIGTTHLSEQANFLQISSSLDYGMAITNNLAVQSNLGVSGDVYLQSNIYVQGNKTVLGNIMNEGKFLANELAIYKNSSLNNATQVGYSWIIDENDKLKLVKYTYFNDDSVVSKKIATFGNSSLQKSDTSDIMYSARALTQTAIINPMAIQSMLNSSSQLVREPLFGLNTASLSTLAEGSEVTAWPATASGRYTFSPAPQWDNKSGPIYHSTGGGVNGTLPWVEFSIDNSLCSFTTWDEGPNQIFGGGYPIPFRAGTNGGFTIIQYVNMSTIANNSSLLNLGDWGTMNYSYFNFGFNRIAEDPSKSTPQLLYQLVAPGQTQLQNTGGVNSPMAWGDIVYENEPGHVGLRLDPSPSLTDQWIVVVVRYTGTQEEMFWFNAETTPGTLTSGLLHIVNTDEIIPAINDNFSYATINSIPYVGTKNTNIEDPSLITNDNFYFSQCAFKLAYTGLWDRPLTDIELASTVNSVLVGSGVVPSIDPPPYQNVPYLVDNQWYGKTLKTNYDFTSDDPIVDIDLKYYIFDSYGSNDITYTIAESYLTDMSALNLSLTGTNLHFEKGDTGTTKSFIFVATNLYGSTSFTFNVIDSLLINLNIPYSLQELGSVILTSNQTATYNLPDYITDINGGANITYTITSNPNNNASISTDGTNILSITDNGAGAQYIVEITATNSNGPSVFTLNVTDSTRLLPYSVQTLGPVTLEPDQVGTYNLPEYITDINGGADITYSITSNPNNNASITNNILNVIGASSLFQIQLTAINLYGSTSFTLYVHLPITSIPPHSTGWGISTAIYPDVNLTCTYTSAGTNLVNSSYLWPGTLDVHAWLESFNSVTNGYPNGVWWQVQLSKEICISGYSFNIATTSTLSEWYVLGSQDGSTYTTIDHQTTPITSNNSSTFTYNVENTNSYLYYRFVVVATGAESVAIGSFYYIVGQTNIFPTYESSVINIE